MENEEIIKRLAYALKDAGVDKDTGVNISLRLRKPGKAEQLLEWMEQNKTATPEEICQKSREIAKHSLEEALEQDEHLRESGELQEIMSRAVLSQGSRIDAQFLAEASEEHRKAEADGTLYERTRPRAGMRS